jgi:hypothetical protein
MRKTSVVVCIAALGVALSSCGGGAKADARYPARPPGCDVQLFRGKIRSIPYDDIGHVDAICSIEMSLDACERELKDQTCKLGGDLVYDVPQDPQKPSPDKIRLTGHVAHTRAAAPAK